MRRTAGVALKELMTRAYIVLEKWIWTVELYDSLRICGEIEHGKYGWAGVRGFIYLGSLS
jgi:hypothetical protein